MKKTIVIISALLSFFGLTSLFLDPFKHREFINYFSLFNFEFSDLLREYCHNFGVVNFFFYLVFIIGTLVYAFSKYKETRLLRFVFSIVLISKLVFLPFWIYGSSLFVKFKLIHPEQFPNFSWVNIILFYTFQILVIVVSYRIVKYLNSSRELDFSEKVYGENISKEYVVATKGQRLTNYLFDTLIWIILYSSVFKMGKNLLEMYSQLDSSLGNDGTMGQGGQWGSSSSANNDFVAVLYLLSFRFFYYLFFELVFRATPAKFLTETKVMDYDGESTNFQGIFLRNLFRNIPLNPVTFLFGYNLHDNWSNTEVFQEKRVGASGNKYLGYFFAAIGLVGLLYFGNVTYAKIQRDNYETHIFEEKLAHNKQALSELATGDIIVISGCNLYDRKEYILKVGEVKDGKVYFKKVDAESYNYPEEESIIRDGKKYFSDELEVFQVDKKDLSKSIISADEMKRLYNMDEKNLESIGFNLLKDNKNYYIKNVFSLSKPILKIEQGGYSQSDYKITELTFRISNVGISSKLIAVKSNQDDVSWSVENATLPVEIPVFMGYSNNYTLSLKGKGSNIKDSDFTISVQDSIGKKYKYQVISSNDISSEIIIKRL